MRQHRGVGEASLRRYEYHLVELLDCLGDDPSRFTAQKLRGFVQQQSRNYSSTGGTKKLYTAVRMFLRHLTIEGKCPAGLNYALPSLAGWSQQGVPRCLPATDVEKLIATCDQTDKVGMRDRAILLLLARLGLRAGDVASLRLSDISWPQATIRVSGKGQREALLPLPQDVGDAILTYLEIGRPHVESDHIFLRCCAPFRPFAHGGPVSLIVRRVFLQSGIKSPSLGSHVLRHSVASEMLRQGTPLYGIATVLRHCSIETTTIYAKVDLDLLRGVAQPWPEVQAYISAQNAIEWARQGSSPAERSFRLKTVACFARYLSAEDARHEVPADDVLAAIRSGAGFRSSSRCPTSTHSLRPLRCLGRPALYGTTPTHYFCSAVGHWYEDFRSAEFAV
jgi:integrase/recombinase XerD